MKTAIIRNTVKIGKTIENTNLRIEKIADTITPKAKRNIGAKMINIPKARNSFIVFILL
jgi:hypothetical protein